MKTHSEYKDMLPELAAGELNEGLRRHIEAHISECPECAGEYSLIRETLKTFAEPAFDMPSPAYFGSLVPSVRARLEQKRRFGWRRAGWLRWAGTAAAAVAIAFTAFIVTDRKDAPQEELFYLSDVGVLVDPIFAEYSPLDFISEYASDNELAMLETAYAQEAGIPTRFFDIDTKESNEFESLSDDEIKQLINRLGEERYF